LLESFQRVFMKKIFLFSFFLIFTITLQAQKDTLTLLSVAPQKDFIKGTSNINVSIFPVPVKDNSFTIKCDREISSVRVTNIIGQDIFRVQHNNPQTITKVLLDNPKRGMYLVTIIFTDGTRVVRKIMVEEVE
jgi:hypothetical protein